MIKSRKDLDWSAVLSAEMRAALAGKIDAGAWYPMAVFEKLGNAILKLVANDDVELVRQWGYHSVDALCEVEPGLLAAGDPAETLTRFRVMRATFFDFDALQIPMLHIDEADVVISYGMGRVAEEAASWQAAGFFQRLLERAGATDITTSFAERSWAGDARTLLKLSWTP